MSTNAVTIKLIGFDELYKDLKQVEEKTARRILRNAIRAGAKVVLEEAKLIVPVKTGKLKSDLRIKSKRRKGSINYQVTTGSSGGSGSLFTGDTYYGGFIEYGTKHILPHMFIRGAFDDNKERILDAARSKLGSGIERALKK